MVLASRWAAKQRMQGRPMPSRKLLLEGSHDADIINQLRGLEDFALEYRLPMKGGYNKGEVIERTIREQSGPSRTFGLVDMDHDYNGRELANLCTTLGQKHGIDLGAISPMVHDTRPECCLVDLFDVRADLMDASFLSRLRSELHVEGVTIPVANLESWWPVITRIAVFRTWLHHHKTLHPNDLPQGLSKASKETTIPNSLDIFEWDNLQKEHAELARGRSNINDHCIEATLTNFLCMPDDQNKSWNVANRAFLQRTKKAFSRAFLARLKIEDVEARRVLPFLFDEDER